MAEPVGRTVKKKAKAQTPIVLGWREWIGFPDLGLDAVMAKMDSGAKSSAMHASDIKILKVNGKHVVEFCVHPVQQKMSPKIVCQAPLVGQRTIRSSNGLTEKRYVIETRLKLGKRRWKIELTLTNREDMDFRVLLGRDAIKRKFMIDPNASYLLGKKMG